MKIGKALRSRLRRDLKRFGSQPLAGGSPLGLGCEDLKHPANLPSIPYRKPERLPDSAAASSASSGGADQRK